MNLHGSTVPVRFGATRLMQDVWLAIKSNGDGSYSAVPFTSAREADRFAEAEMMVSGEGRPDVESIRTVYETAEEYIRKTYGDSDRRLNYLA